MAITGDPNAVAIATFKTIALSMGDCFIKITPEAKQTTYEVTGQFVGLDSASPFLVSAGLRQSAESYLDTVVGLIGGIAEVQEVKGPKGTRVIVPSTYTVGSLVNPFSGQTYAGLALVNVSSQDQGGRHYEVTYTFIKPTSVSNDGTASSTIKFDGNMIGDRGGFASISADGSVFQISATSQYVGANPLTYIASLCETLGLNPSNVAALARGASGNRATIKSYNSTIGVFEWVGKGTVSGAVLQTLQASEDTPGIFTINTTFTAPR